MKIAFLTKIIKICKVLFQHRVMKDLGLLKFGVVCCKLGLQFGIWE